MVLPRLNHLPQATWIALLIGRDGTTHLGLGWLAVEVIRRGTSTGYRQPSLFQNIRNMQSSSTQPGNPHVAFHIPNVGVTLQPPLHCLALLDFLPDLALGLAGGQRNKSKSDEPE